MDSLNTAIADRSIRLRRLGRWTARLGLILLGVGIAVMAPDPAGPDLLGEAPQGLYAAVPPELFHHLKKSGAAVREMPPGWGAHGATMFSALGLGVIVLLLIHAIAGWLIPSARMRAIALLTLPVWFLPVYLLFSILGPFAIPAVMILGGVAYPILGRPRISMAGRLIMISMLPVLGYMAISAVNQSLNVQSQGDVALTARIGTVADGPGGPAVAPDGTVTSDPMRLKPGGQSAEMKATIPSGWVMPYVLQPMTLTQPMRDEAHYLLAQQAYMHDDPRTAAFHLRQLTGGWLPPDWATRGRIGSLAEWARLRGSNPGAWPARIAKGAPFIAVRRVLGWLTVIIGGLAALAGLYFCHLSQKLRQTAFQAVLRSGTPTGTPLPTHSLTRSTREREITNGSL